MGFCFAVGLSGNRETPPTPKVYPVSDFEVTNVNVYQGKDGEEVFVKSFRVVGENENEAINQAIAQEREQIAKEVRTIRMPYPNPYGEYVRVPKVNRIIDRILQIITNKHE